MKKLLFTLFFVGIISAFSFTHKSANPACYGGCAGQYVVCMDNIGGTPAGSQICAGRYNACVENCINP